MGSPGCVGHDQAHKAVPGVSDDLCPSPHGSFRGSEKVQPPPVCWEPQEAGQEVPCVSPISAIDGRGPAPRGPAVHPQARGAVLAGVSTSFTAGPTLQRPQGHSHFPHRGHVGAGLCCGLCGCHSSWPQSPNELGILSNTKPQATAALPELTSPAALFCFLLLVHTGCLGAPSSVP